MSRANSNYDADIVIHQAEAKSEKTARSIRRPDGSLKRMITTLCVLLFALCLLSVLFQTDIRNQSYTLQEYLQKVYGRGADLRCLLLEGKNVNGIGYIVCTCLTAALAGAALSASGAVYQSIFRNPMASPSLLGVQSGGLLGGVIYILFFLKEDTAFTFYTQKEFTRIINDMSFLERNIQEAFIIAGCFIGAMLVVGASTSIGRGRMSTFFLFLSGSIFSSLCSAVVMLAEYYIVLHDSDTSRLLAIQTINMGSFGGAYSPAHLAALSVMVLPPLLVLMLLRRRINVLTFGDEQARSLGIQPGRLRLLCFILCTVMIGGTLAMVGRITFVGLLVPHLARRISGPSMERLFPVTALLGAVITVLVYDVAGFTGFSSMINLITTSVGGVVFVASLAWHRRQRDADWA